MPAPYADREAIRALSARYSVAADSRDLDAYADCFVSDGAFEIVGLVRLEGSASLTAMIGALDFPTHHVTADAVIDVDGDTAAQQCSFMLFGRAVEENQVRLITTATYHDQLRRTADGWRFVERRTTTINDLGRALVELSPRFAATMARL